MWRNMHSVDGPGEALPISDQRPGDDFVEQFLQLAARGREPGVHGRAAVTRPDPGESRAARSDRCLQVIERVRV